jgi:prepilin-type N-terminal cleavage/methylation domain-containing protein
LDVGVDSFAAPPAKTAFTLIELLVVIAVVLADTNGLMQFDDTNAPNYAARFYITSPQ